MDPTRSRAMSVSSNGSYIENSRHMLGARKPALCRHWVAKVILSRWLPGWLCVSCQGHCDLGSGCKFAHSPQDLSQSNNDRTKTQLCSKFSATGFCQVSWISSRAKNLLFSPAHFSTETAVALPMESSNWGPVTHPTCSLATIRPRCAKPFCQEEHVLLGLSVTMLMGLESSETCSSQ